MSDSNSDDTRHQWTILAVYELPEEQIVELQRTHADVPLKFDTILSIEGPGCFRCEQTWEEAKGKPCPGGERLPKDTLLHLRRSGRYEEIDRVGTPINEAFKRDEFYQSEHPSNAELDAEVDRG